MQNRFLKKHSPKHFIHRQICKFQNSHCNKIVDNFFKWGACQYKLRKNLKLLTIFIDATM